MTALPPDVVADLRLENARLLTELRAARDRQAGSAEILRAIAGTSGDAERSLQQIAEITARLFGASSVTLNIASGDEWARMIRVGPSSQRVGSEVSAAQLRIGGRNLPGTVFRENRQIHIPDLDNLDPAFADWPTLPHARAAGTRVLAGTPLRREQKAIGVLVVHRDQPDPFTAEELALQQSFADQAVIAIENARLFNETKEALDRQDATAEILRTIASAPGDAGRSLQQIAQTSARLFGAPSVSIQLVEDGEWGEAYRFGDSAQRIRSAVPLAKIRVGGPNMPGAVVGQNRQFHVPDLDHLDPSVADWPGLPHARAAGTRTMSGTPLRREGKAIGALIIYRDRLLPFTPEELALQQSFADQAVIAIENARLFNETQEALARQIATSDILRVISLSPTDVQPVFDAIVRTSVRLLGCDSAFFLRCDDITYTPVAGTTAAGMLTELGSPQPIDPGANFPSRAIVEKKTLHVRDFSLVEVPEYDLRVHETFGINSALFLPLLREGKCIGLLALAGKRAGMFGESEITLAESFRDQALIAIENTRLFNETREALERQTATADILKVIASSPSDVQPVFDAIATSANRLIGGLSTAVHSLVDDTLHLTAFTPTSPAGDAALQASFPRPLSALPWGEQMRNGELVHISDVEVEGAMSPDLQDLARMRGFRSMLRVPLLRDRVPIGFISVTRVEPGMFAAHHVQLLQTFADQAVIAIENARLFNETREALDRQTATAEILKVIASSPSDVQPVFDVIVERAVRLCGGRMGRVYRYHDGVIQMVAGHGLSAPGLGKVQQVFPRPATDDTIAGQVMLSRRPYILADIKDDATVPALSRQMIEALGTRSQVTMPMLLAGEPIGAITVGWADPGAYKDQQITLLQTFADQAVIAIENVRLFNETREALERQTATADILKVIASSPSDVQPVFDAIAASANRLIGGFSTAVFRFVDGVSHLAAFTPTHPAADEVLKTSFPRPVAEFRPFELARNGEAVQIADTETSPDLPVKDISRARGYRSMLFTPLMSNGAPIGMISVTRKEPGRFAAHHVQLLQTFADQAVIAIENVRLFNETREALERQTATADILKVIASSPSDVQPVFDAIAASANRLIGGHSTTVFSIVDDIMHLSALTPTSPTADAALKAAFPRPLSGQPWAEQFRNGEIAHVPDIEAESGVSADLRDLWRMRGFRALLLVPLRRERASIGMISVTRKEPGRFAAHHVQLLQTFADQAVIAIENTRLFNETREALERQTETADILKVIASSPSDVQPVFDAIAASANKLLGGFSTAVFRFVDDIAHLAAFTPTTPAADRVLQSSFPMPLANFEQFELAKNGQPVQTADIEQMPNRQIREIARMRGFRSMLFVPLMNSGVPIGLISVTRTETGSFADHHIQLLQTFADQAVIAIENVRLFNEVKQRTEDLSESLQQQTATSEVLKVISRSAFDLDAVLATLVESATTLCEAERGMIFLRRENHYHMTTNYGFSPELEAFARAHPFSIDAESTTARAAASGIAVQAVDLLADQTQGELAREYQRLGGHRTNLGVPLRRKGETIGVFTLTRQVVRPFTEKQIELVSTFADQAVIAIENVRLFDEVQAKTRDLSAALTYQTGSSNILRVIASSPTDVEPVLKAIVESACELCEADDALATLKDGNDLVFQAQHGSIPVVWERMPINRQWASGRAVVDRKPVHVHDLLATGGEQFPDSQEFARRTSVRTVLSVPLLRENESIGAIVLRRTEVQPFSDKQIALLQTFADQAVIAIGNVRLFEEVQARTRDLTESLQQQTATAEVLKVISASPGELEPVFQAMLENAVHLCEAKFAMLFLYEEEENEFRAVGEWNLPLAYRDFLGKNTIHADPMIPLGRVAKTKQPIQVPDVLADQSYIERYPGMVGVGELGGARTLLQVPMLKENELVGTIGIYRQEVRPFTDKQIALVRNFAAQAVIAIENARLLNELRQRTDDLTESLEDLRTAQDRLIQTEKLASLGQLTAGIAHEIKNPLNFVNNFSALSAELTDELNDLLKSAEFSGKMRDEVGELTSMLKDNLEKVVQHGKRADSIVKNMLLHSREGSGEHRPADINALLDESLNLAYHGARAEKREFNVTLQRDFDEMAGTIEVFPQEITRALLNLISNGFYAVTKRKTENGSTGFDPVLRATTRNLGDTVEIRIRDNGIGIPAEVKEKMFNPFFTTKPAGEGTGLGLSMSHDIIVKQHGGTIDVETEPGQFTEFTIVLPRTSNLQEKKRGQM